MYSLTLSSKPLQQIHLYDNTINQHISYTHYNLISNYCAARAQGVEKQKVSLQLKGYTKNHAVKNMPMASRTTVRWGNTAGFTGLVYLVMASSSCKKGHRCIMGRNKHHIQFGSRADLTAQVGCHLIFSDTVYMALHLLSV